MECQECVKENAYSIKHRGYGYGYIGKYLNCSRHNKKSQQIEQLPTKSQQIEQLPTKSQQIEQLPKPYSKSSRV
jgi:hypothetical protein